LLTQSVTIPAGCHDASLSFYLHVITAYDKLAVKAGSTTVGTFQSEQQLGVRPEVVRRSTQAGQTVTIRVIPDR
jgi:hypothetical protein